MITLRWHSPRLWLSGEGRGKTKRARDVACKKISHAFPIFRRVLQAQATEGKHRRGDEKKRTYDRKKNEKQREKLSAHRKSLSSGKRKEITKIIDKNEPEENEMESEKGIDLFQGRLKPSGGRGGGRRKGEGKSGKKGAREEKKTPASGKGCEKSLSADGHLAASKGGGREVQRV